MALISTLITLASPAEASHIGCGDVITEDTTLDSDIGPCPGVGIIVGADNITVNLGGHTVIGNPESRPNQEMVGETRDRAGVLLRQVRGVTVTDGTVSGFDAGVAIMGGGGNTVRRITAHDNVNYRLVTGQEASPDDVDRDEGPFCWFGDGITLFNSSGNVVEHNRLVANGPFSGVSLVGDSDDNVVVRNDVSDHDVVNETPDGEGTICGGLGSPGQPMVIGRTLQDVGIRIEGPGAGDNLVEGNRVVRSGLGGVFVHGYVRATGANNGGNVIRKNRISETGLRHHEVVDVVDADLASGITLHHAQSSAVHVSHGNLIEGNTSSRNFAAGIYAIGPWPSDAVDEFGNTIRDNVTNHNALGGIQLGEGVVHTTVVGNRGHGNGWDKELAREITENSPYGSWDAVDGADNNDDCGTNVWSRNRFGSVNQGCVAAEGTGWVGGPGKSADAEGGGGGPLSRGLPQRD
ncbi:MAG: right-handed parallel beta-helix repeat-containing protein [Actinobacteria bacterium]|nr:right-handed parallel beta-helix repeat-containing protein [Actinomycetota bacterium]